MNTGLESLVPFPCREYHATEHLIERLRTQIINTGQQLRNPKDDPLRHDIDVIWHTGAELCLFHDLAAGIYDSRPIPGYVFQCGIFCGASACAFALGQKRLNDKTPIVAIDIYHKKRPAKYKQIMDWAYIESRENFWALELEKNIVAINYDDVKYLEWFWDSPIRIAFIDSDHTYEHATREINLISPYIVKDGWLLLHDYKLSEGVRQAVDEWRASYHNRHIYPYLFGSNLIVIKFDSPIQC